jgi:hypothetical protein
VAGYSKPKKCKADCLIHPEHIYVLCFGEPTVIKSRDYLQRDHSENYPISHYVGYTSQHPPMKRVKQHGAFCAGFLVGVYVGDEIAERKFKAFGDCPKCSRDLWYYAESPNYTEDMAPPIVRSFREWNAEWLAWMKEGDLSKPEPRPRLP